eukprot:14330850-Heterocapsa_arctica.AAC.1
MPNAAPSASAQRIRAERCEVITVRVHSWPCTSELRGGPSHLQGIVFTHISVLLDHFLVSGLG